MNEQTTTFNLIHVQREIRTLDRQIARLLQQRTRLIQYAADLEAILQRRHVPFTVLPPVANDGAI